MKLKIAHLYPELLNLYGDGGNIICMQKRCEWRGIEAEVYQVHNGELADFSDVDIVFIGGGTDREQKIVCDALLSEKEQLHAYVEAGGVLLAVCGGYQLLGHNYLLGDELVKGTGVVDLKTERGEGRLIGNVMIQSDICKMPIVGYENHGGRTYLGDCHPLGKVISAGGYGNNGTDGYEGVHYKNVIGTYLHGPLLPKNPQVCDYLLHTALTRRYGEGYDFPALDDTIENNANQVMQERLKENVVNKMKVNARGKS
ncbi:MULTISPECIES: type 1 glutamine amidotransferase [Caproicibacterium]|jgi:hypothetical protein|uniref:Lipid II isoglutaminyl synthase (glutamine-hydrolyzing) subunit GatD n=1 Tax=Caproicibacterium lactatifermentans TaxID=2666138 RepID=A0A859DR28_9FIRM|nr:glutamine amidotransferase [Caproicibacterium lactatifermentans]ARP50373.1 glutamine amidotransferase [Ruminococcaceae bacterium CPB6]QKN23905.1 glutamine amidotransferase [Caproicibacterium lactatifermentans]QKO31025.1 glutamine amidotransferase [Caproicibacterium lactatifermentans]